MEQKPVTLNTVIIASTLTCLVVGGLLYTVRKEMADQLVLLAGEQQSANEKLGKKIAALESQTSELAARPTTDTATIDGLKNELTTAKSTIGELTERITQLEKKPEPAPVVEAPTAAHAANGSLGALKSAVTTGSVYEAELDIWEKEHPKSGNKVNKLRASAATGLPTEERLRGELRELLNKSATAEAAFPDGSMVSRINNRLSGLISIKKQTAVSPDLQALKDSVGTAPLETLKAKVAALPKATAPIFADWVHTVDTRKAALDELNTLDAQ